MIIDFFRKNRTKDVFLFLKFNGRLFFVRLPLLKNHLWILWKNL